ncbi:hypothetical protein OPS25_08250 [Alteromonas ponticola]|uniref:Zinc ribbon domain-containing protein n=1 Tax=Alteromonas aquimaris TaxID=2998417 RepID=A0ABT3P6X8_9ALTE|nr:hypothetical protein [Alteromonas aquimaris]MCW8108484.1 hypothetical protein [Alteromonas aquimaris]
MSHEEIFFIFSGVWIVLIIISFLVFFVSKNAERKKKLWVPFIIFAGALFIVVMYLMDSDKEEIYFMVPMIVLISFFNIRSTKFCSACGKTNKNYNFFSQPKYCSDCGQALE